jgi:HTH-type transcriptional regulator/antitoxin HipB
MNNSKVLPSGKTINSSDEFGKLIRHKRKQDKLTQIELAELTGVGVRFLSELENGKPTVQLEKVFQVMLGLGLKMRVGL